MFLDPTLDPRRVGLATVLDYFDGGYDRISIEGPLDHDVDFAFRVSGGVDELLRLRDRHTLPRIMSAHKRDDGLEPRGARRHTQS